MRVPVLVKVSAGLCAVFGLLQLGYIAFFPLVAPGYLHTLTAGQRLTLALPMALGVYGLSTAVGLLRRSAWARIAILLLAGVLLLEGIVVGISLLASNNAAAMLFIAPASNVVIGVSWLVVFNMRQSKACFTRQ